jgi:tight adherence protein C
MRPAMFLGLVAGAAVLGLMLPNLVIGQRRKTCLAEIDRGLADGLDMMVICAEAGLGLEATLNRVSVEIVHAHSRLAAELARTSSELGMASDSRTALTNLGARTGLPGLTRLATTMIQSQQYGTPLSASLRTLATELRQETLTRFEERAARLPVLLTVPMIVFILPCVFLIVAGPIVVQVFRALKH